MSDAPSVSKPRNLLFPAVVGLVASGGGALLCLRRAWSITAVTGLPVGEVTVTGADVAGGATGLAVLVLASSLGILAAGPRLRRWIGGLVVVAGIGGIVLVAGASARMDEARRRALDAAGASGGGDIDWSGGPWPWVTIALFALAAVVGLVVLARGHRWPTMGGRYEAPSARPADPSDLWKAIDDGVDPTV